VSRDAAARTAVRYAIAVTRAVAAIIDPNDPADPIARQYLPDPAELLMSAGESADPTADKPFTPVKGVVHRYPDRALLKPLLTCPVYCRFCFRREVVGQGDGTLDDRELETALDWFAEHADVREAILTGGDPLMLSPRRLAAIVGRLGAMPHIEIVRIHTRVPVADPRLVTGALVDALATDKALFVCVHANHAREFGGAAPTALRQLALGGAALLGQSVLLRGVNDGAEVLEDLFRAMLRHRVKPYYLHQFDPAPGTARFVVPPEEGLAILRELRSRLSGIGWPTYVRETPGGGGKVPLGPTWPA
jgi:lysine 2,3-aminomutase